jgi:hypothetical protein
MNDPKDMRAEVLKPRKIALYLSIEHGWYSVWEVRYTERDEHYRKLEVPREEPRANYVRVSEPVDIEFRPINSDQVVANAVEALNEAERALLREMNSKIAEIRNRKAQLRCLTHEPEAS